MDFKKLAKVADSVSGVKRNVPVKGKSVVDEENPLNALDDRDKIIDSSSRVIVIDDEFLNNLKKAPRDRRRLFLSRLPDSQRRRVLQRLKKINDNKSTQLGFILFDDLLANVVVDPSKDNIDSLDRFVQADDYKIMTKGLRDLVSQLESGSVDLSEDSLNELRNGLENRTSHFISNLGVDLEDDFEVPNQEPLTEEDEGLIRDSVKKHIELFKVNKNFKEVVDAVEDLMQEFQGKNRNYQEASASYWKRFEDEWKSQFSDDIIFTSSKDINEVIDSALDIADADKLEVEGGDTLDTIFEGPAIDNGKEVKDVEETSIMGLLSEALSDYADGDTSKLDALAQQSLSNEVGSEITEEPEEEEVDLNEDSTEEQLQDSAIHFARRIKQGKVVNKLVDSLKSKVKSLNLINFKKTDCCLPNAEMPGTVSTINMPITREEYYSICPRFVSPLMQEMLNERCCAEDKLKCPPVDNCIVENGLANINSGSFYYPVNASTFEERLNSAENNQAIQEIISSEFIPLEDAMYCAAKCDNLPFIDTRFYKSNLGMKGWCFDEVPPCIEGCPEGNCIERCCEDEANYHLFGVPYFVY